MAARRMQRPLVALALFAAAGIGIGTAVARGSSTPDPSDVAREIHDDVARDVLDRTHDFTASIGPLDCVETSPGRGSCLANLVSASHRADHVMIAVHYDVDPNGKVTWMVRLP